MHHDWHMEATGSKYLPWVCISHECVRVYPKCSGGQWAGKIGAFRLNIRLKGTCEGNPQPCTESVWITASPKLIWFIDFLDYLLQWKVGHTISGCYLGFRDCKWMFPQSLATLLLHFLKDYFSFYFFFFISFFLGPILQLEWIFFSHLNAACFRFQHLMESLYFE